MSSESELGGPSKDKPREAPSERGEVWGQAWAGRPGEQQEKGGRPRGDPLCINSGWGGQVVGYQNPHMDSCEQHQRLRPPQSFGGTVKGAPEAFREREGGSWSSGKPGHWKSLGASKEDGRAPSWKGMGSPLRLWRGEGAGGVRGSSQGRR